MSIVDLEDIARTGAVIADEAGAGQNDLISSRKSSANGLYY
jgi:hypothetical protein